MQVKYFNSRSTRLWLWRAGLRTRIANRLQTERNARCHGFGKPIPDWGTAKVFHKVQEQAAYKAWLNIEEADNNRSPMIATMANHRAAHYTALAEG